MIEKEAGHTGKVRVTFFMPAGIWADSIYLVGDFNGWNETATPLKLSENGWGVSLELNNGEAYQYRYLVNGTDWYNDWRADRYEPNSLGGDNSVVVASLPHETPRQPVPVLPRQRNTYSHPKTHAGSRDSGYVSVRTRTHLADRLAILSMDQNMHEVEAEVSNVA